MSDSSALIAETGSTNVDTMTVTTGFGTVKRQRVGLQQLATSADSQSGSNLDMVALAGDNPLGVFDHIRTLAASGYGLGAVLIGGAFDDASNGLTFTQVNSGTAFWQNRSSKAIKQRTLIVSNTTNVTVTFTVALAGLAVSTAVLIFTLTAGGTAIVSKGVAFASAGTYTRTQGNEALLDAPADNITVSATGTGATSGQVNADLLQVA